MSQELKQFQSKVRSAPAWDRGTLAAACPAGAGLAQGDPRPGRETVACSPSSEHILPILWVPTCLHDTLSQPCSPIISLEKSKVAMILTAWPCSSEDLLK